MLAPFDALHLSELNHDNCEALRARVRRFSASAWIIEGDANEAVHEIVAAIPGRSLSLAFLDPHGLHLHYDTLKTLATRRADLGRQAIPLPAHLLQPSPRGSGHLAEDGAEEAQRSIHDGFRCLAVTAGNGHDPPP